MQKVKLVINIQEGVLDVEGEESFVREVYQDFRGMCKADSAAVASVRKRQETRDKDGGAVSRNPEKYTLVPSLELSSQEEKIGLQDFIAQKQPITAFDHNAVFVYYLQKIQNREGITLNHIYTCYKYALVKLPSAFRQSVLDTSYKKHFLDTRSLKDIRLTVRGENYVDHELPL